MSISYQRTGVRNVNGVGGGLGCPRPVALARFTRYIARSAECRRVSASAPSTGKNARPTLQPTRGVSTHPTRNGHSRPHSLHDVVCLLLAGTGKEQGELIASQPRHGVTGANGLLQPACDPAEHLITDQVAPGVVNDLEVVQIQQDQGNGEPEARNPSIWLIRTVRLTAPVSGSWR